MATLLNTVNSDNATQHFWWLFNARIEVENAMKNDNETIHIALNLSTQNFSIIITIIVIALTNFQPPPTSRN